MFSLATLSKLIPFRDYVYAALAIAAVTYYNVHVHNLIKADEHKRDAAVAAESVKVLANAHKVMDDLSAQHASDLKIAQEQYDEQSAKDSAHYTADLQRLRQLAAAQGSGSPALGGPGGPDSASGQGEPGSGSLGFVPAELGAELADALRATRDQRDLCYADRDSLTGK